MKRDEPIDRWTFGGMVQNIWTSLKASGMGGICCGVCFTLSMYEKGNVQYHLGARSVKTPTTNCYPKKNHRSASFSSGSKHDLLASVINALP